jgi:hypothetical protein
MIYRLDDLAQLLGATRRQIIDADRHSKHGLLSWTQIHGGYCCSELLLPELRKAIDEMPTSKATKRARMPRVQLRHKLT